MIPEPDNKLDYLLNYFEVLSNTKTKDGDEKWNKDALQRVSKEISELIDKRK
ncbi:hypothetical protein [Sporolactobacillus terrae]|uniref:Uncharacterized protein n=1 Tax=Sporolactobacillus terrae TaxID=269673 RepID=A0A5K7WY16_9BACL|nr:hypothetical protein [Sporolactobacillus terrae]BBN97488.1 hypothetical protein St703_01930 [Sporolactobacillus terrae]